MKPKNPVLTGCIFSITLDLIHRYSFKCSLLKNCETVDASLKQRQPLRL